MTTDLHLKLTNVDNYPLTDSTYLTRIVEHLAVFLGTKPTPTDLLGTTPYIITYPTPNGTLGHTVFLPIEESFIAIETWPEDKRATLVIVSCKEFDEITACELIRSYFFEPSMEGVIP